MPPCGTRGREGHPNPQWPWEEGKLVIMTWAKQLKWAARVPLGCGNLGWPALFNRESDVSNALCKKIVVGTVPSVVETLLMNT